MLTRHAKLITPLCTLLEKRSLTDASEALSLTKSATSKILKKGRELFGDPLLERQGNTMILTPIGKDLLPKLQRLRTAAAEFFPDQQDIAAFSGRFSLQLIPGIMYIVGEHIADAIAKALPNVRLSLEDVSDNFLEHLTSGATDMVAYIHGDFPYPFETVQLYESKAGIFIPKGHPLTGQSFNYQQLQEQPLMLGKIPVQGARYEAAIKMLQPQSGEKRVLFESNNIPLLFQQALKRQAVVLGSQMLILDPWIREHFTMQEQSGSLTGVLQRMNASLISHNRTRQSVLHRKIEAIVEKIICDMNHQALEY